MADVAFAISVLVAAVTVLRNHAVIFVDKTCVQSCYLCFEHILLKSSKGLGTSSNNLLVPLLEVIQCVMRNR